MHAGAFNSYTGQLAVSVQENAAANGQWAEGKVTFEIDVTLYTRKHTNKTFHQIRLTHYSVSFAGFFF